jgi:flavin-binding protein dodecin
MPDHVYKTIELTGSSSKGSDDAVRIAIAKATRTLRSMRWFQVVETRGTISKDRRSHSR